MSVCPRSDPEGKAELRGEQGTAVRQAAGGGARRQRPWGRQACTPCCLVAARERHQDWEVPLAAGPGRSALMLSSAKLQGLTSRGSRSPGSVLLCGAGLRGSGHRRGGGVPAACRHGEPQPRSEDKQVDIA